MKIKITIMRNMNKLVPLKIINLKSMIMIILKVTLHKTMNIKIITITIMKFLVIKTMNPHQESLMTGIHTVLMMI